MEATETAKPKGLFEKLKENVDDHEEQMVILGAMVRLGVVIWSGFIITLNYVELPMFKKSPGGDITFPASIFTGALATFGLSTGNGNGKKNGNPDKKNKTMKKWLLLILLASPTVVRAELVQPNFTQGSMNSTTTTTQDITEEITTTTYGAALNKWSGDNITHTSASSGGLVDEDSIFTIHTAGSDFSLEVVSRAASQVIELTEIDRTIETESTTVSLSVFSQ